MTANKDNKDSIDDLCVGLLINKAKHAKFQSAQIPQPEQRSVVLSEALMCNESIDSEYDDTPIENQFLLLIQACKQEINTLKREVHALKVEIGLLSTKCKKD